METFDTILMVHDSAAHSRSEIDRNGPNAMRGLSPGTQKVFTLTEAARARYGLSIGRDVIPCVTTLRHLPADLTALTENRFRKYYRDAGQKCWLIRSDRTPSPYLQAYLDSVPVADYQTATCLERAEWWKFRLPPIATLLMSMSFRDSPKVVKNAIKACAVGGVCGVYNVNAKQARVLASRLAKPDVRSRIVAHSNGLRKIEINQLNGLLQETFGKHRATG